MNGQRNIRKEKTPDAKIDSNYAKNKKSQPYGEIVSCFRHLAEDNILQTQITQRDFVTSNKNPDDNPGCNLYVFDIRHQQDYSSSQPIKVRFVFRPTVPAATKIIGYALQLTNKLLSYDTITRHCIINNFCNLI